MQDIASISEGTASLSNVLHLDYRGVVCIGLPLVHASLLVQCSNLSVNAIDHWVGDRVSAQGEPEIIRRTHQYILQLRRNLVVNLIQTEVQVLELRASHQEPVCRFVTIWVASHLAFDCVEDGNGLFWLFLLLQLFVFLDDSVTLFQLGLISLNLVSREGNSAEAFQDGQQIIRC